VRRVNPAFYIAIPMIALFIGVVGFGLGPVVLGHFRTQRIMASGTPGTAEVIELSDSGNRVNHQPVANVRLTVQPPSGAPYETVSQVVVSGINSPVYQPGHRVSVKIDPDKPSRVVILGPAPPLAPKPGGSP
jgi:hypothetical protein